MEEKVALTVHESCPSCETESRFCVVVEQNSLTKHTVICSKCHSEFLLNINIEIDTWAEVCHGE